MSAVGSKLNRSRADVQTVINEALGVGADKRLKLPTASTKAAKSFAEQLDAKLKTGGSVSDGEIGTLYYMVMSNGAQAGADRTAAQRYNAAKIKKDAEFTVYPQNSQGLVVSSTPREGAAPASNMNKMFDKSHTANNSLLPTRQASYLNDSITQNGSAVNTLYGNGNKTVTNKTYGSGVNNTPAVAGTTAQYSIMKTSDNVPYVKIDRDILAGVPKSEWTETIKKNLIEKYPNVIKVGNNVINIYKKKLNELFW